MVFKSYFFLVFLSILGCSYGINFKKLEEIILNWQKIQDRNCVLVKIGQNRAFEGFLNQNSDIQHISIKVGQLNIKEFIEPSQRNFIYATGCNIFVASKTEILAQNSFFKTLGKAVTNQFWIINDDTRNITGNVIYYFLFLFNLRSINFFVVM